jgi:uncharacterized membrane protein
MFFAILAVLDLLLVICFAFIPFVTRKTELFGVRIPADQTTHPRLVALRRSYRNQMLAAGAALVALTVLPGFVLGPQDPTALAIYLTGIFTYLLLAFLLYLPKHRAMKQIKAQNGWDKAPADKPATIPAATAPSTRDVISPLWLLLYPLVMLLHLGLIALVWPQVPDVVATHFNAAGQADAWTPKGWGAVLPMQVIQLFLAITFIAVYFFIRRSRRQFDAEAMRVSLWQSQRYRWITSAVLTAMGVFSLIFIAALDLLTLTGQMENNPVAFYALLVVFIVVIIGGCLLLMFKVGQGGSRLKEPALPAADVALNSAVNDDSYWKLGMFYFNPADPAVFVEKRFGVGWTNNWARPVSWLLILALLLLTVALLVVVYLLA